MADKPTTKRPTTNKRFTVTITRGMSGNLLRDLKSPDVRNLLIQLEPGDTMTVERVK